MIADLHQRAFSADGVIDLGGAVLSRDEVYRYRLWRHLSPAPRRVLFVMLNPSTADHMKDDRTITRCIGFARREGCGRLDVVNLYAFRTKSPAAMRAARDPIGPDNDQAIAAAVGELASTDLVVAAWGANEHHASDRAIAVTRILGTHVVHALGTTRGDSPRHPLRVRADAPLVRYA